MKRLFLALCISMLPLQTHAQHLSGQVDINAGKTNTLSPTVHLDINQDQLKAWEPKLKAFKSDNIQVLSSQITDKGLELGLKISALFFYDDLVMTLSPNPKQQIQIQLKDNWLPTGLVLGQIQDKLKDWFVVENKDDILTLKALQNKMLEPTKYAIQLQDNTLNLDLKSTHKPGPLVTTQFSNGWDPNGFDQGSSKFAARVKADAHTLSELNLEGEKLIERAQNLDLFFNAVGTYHNLNMKDWRITGEFEFAPSEVTIENQPYRFQSFPFDWRLNPNGFQVTPRFAPPVTFVPQPQKNQLALSVDGPEYFQKIKPELQNAQKYIMQEVFSFYPGKSSAEFVDILLLKALGLQKTATGFVPDPHAPEGVQVFVLHNHKLTAKGAQKLEHFVDEQKAKILEALGPRATQFTQRLNVNFHMDGLKKGIAKTDHRKVLIIDGTQAYTGGLNLGDHYLTDNSFHDLMVQVVGPGIHDIEREFRENWQEVSQIRLPLQSPRLPEQGQSQVQVVPSDEKGWHIEGALVHLIDKAQKDIRLEHAYIYDANIEKALQGALRRGVTIEIIVSEKNDESLFEVLNPQSIADLMHFAKDLPGEVKAWYYTGKGGDQGYMAHTKLMTVDGKYALVGSANLIPRSLQSPFVSLDGTPFLFNEELDLYIEDPQFVKELNTRVFEHDKQQFSKPMPLKELDQYQSKGLMRVIIERLKGLLT